jgi:hypothetical protein
MDKDKNHAEDKSSNARKRRKALMVKNKDSPSSKSVNQNQPHVLDS